MKGKGNRGHQSLEHRLKKRSAHLRNRGRSENQSGEMLDLYLGGDSAVDIAEAYEVTRGAVYSAISKEALFRLMRQKQIERLEEFKEVVEGGTQ